MKDRMMFVISLFGILFLGFTNNSKSQIQNSYKWEKVSYTPVDSSTDFWFEIFFLPSNPNYGWIGGFKGKILRTMDGGKNWSGSFVIDTVKKTSLNYVHSLGVC